MRSEARADVLEHLAEHLPPAGALWAYCEAAVECDGKPVSYTHLTLPTNREV